jgi:hypothetical protein
MTAMKISTSKIILSLLGLFTSISPYLANWNITHIYNPEGTTHAKFHNAQTIVLGTFLGILTLYCLVQKFYICQAKAK